MRVRWNCTEDTYRQFQRLLGRLVDLDPYSEEAFVLRDECRSLPNFPHGYDLDRDVVVPTIISRPSALVRR